MAEAVSIVADLTYAAPDGIPLRADLHLPSSLPGPLPVIVRVHGGGWRSGSRRTAPDLSRFFARAGFAMVAVDYRLTRQAIFPAQIEDLETAIRWVRAVAPEYGLDRGRIGLWGVSAGGHLAALAALTGGQVFRRPGLPHAGLESRVSAVAVGYAPVDFLRLDLHRPPAGVVSDDPESLTLPRKGMRASDADSYESRLLGAPIESRPELVAAANPLTYARAGAPPFLILHGRSDTTVALHQSELLYEGLAAHGNDVTLCAIEGLGHGFLDRSHLDDGGPRRMTRRTSRAGAAERVEECTSAVFPLVEAFFRRTLGVT